MSVKNNKVWHWFLKELAIYRDRHGYDHTVIGITKNVQLPMQSVPITTNVVSSNPVHGKVYSIQYYVK